jgi:hypothetical protein
MIDLKPMLNGHHEVRARVAVCCICHQQHDLRYGVCFHCADQVDGEIVGEGASRTHRLWDTKNPSNSWFVKE